MSGSKVQLVSADTSGEFKVNFWHELPQRGCGYESTVDIELDDDGWRASISIGDMPAQDSPEDAADKLSDYLLAMSKAVKGRKIKCLNLDGMFRPKYIK